MLKFNHQVRFFPPVQDAPAVWASCIWRRGPIRVQAGAKVGYNMTEYTIFVPLLMSRVEFNASSLLGAGKNGFHDALGLSKKCGARKGARGRAGRGAPPQVRRDPFNRMSSWGTQLRLGCVYVQHGGQEPFRSTRTRVTECPHPSGAKQRRGRRVSGVSEY